MGGGAQDPLLSGGVVPTLTGQNFCRREHNAALLCEGVVGERQRVRGVK